MIKKYEMLDDDTVKSLSGRTLKRIRALITIADVVASGELGGYVESEQNLEHDGDAWVSGNAEVSGNARVSGNAQVSGNAWVHGEARVSGNAWVYGDAWVSGNAQVSGNAEVSGNAVIFWASKVGTENGTLTVYNSKDNVLLCTRGCFSGTVDEFLAASKEYHNKRTHKEYKLLIKVAKSRIERGLEKEQTKATQALSASG